MALISCSECSNEVSQLAESCPNCGYPVKFEYEKSEVLRKINDEKLELIDSKKLLEKKLAKIIIPDPPPVKIISLCIGLLSFLSISVLAFVINASSSAPTPVPSLMALIAFFSIFTTFCAYIVGGFLFSFGKGSKKRKQAINNIAGVKRKLDKLNKSFREIADNQQYINSPSVSPQVVATLAVSGCGLYQMTSIRKQMEKMNENLADNVGDASGGEGESDFSGGEAGGDFGGFI